MSSAQPFKSELKTGAERYLSQVIVSALKDGWRTPDDFLRHFKPADLMQRLEKAPDLRATILVQAAGVHERIAKKKSTGSAAEDLRIALDEGVTTPVQVLDLIGPDDRVRHLERAKLWSFVTEEQFWLPGSSAAHTAVARMVYLLESAMAENLLSIQDFTDGVTFETISARLPQKELQRIVKFALEAGRKKAPFNEDSLLDLVSFKDLLGYLPLDHVYKRVLVAKVAQPAGFVSTGVGEEAWPEEDHPPQAEPKEVKVEAPKVEAKDTKKATKPAKEEKEPSEETVTDEELEEVPPGSAGANSTRPPAEEDARRKVADRLSAISRLPPRHVELSTPILLSIDSMYAELLAASSDEGREAAIRDSFPNESHMSTALLALIELLDPSIDVNDPVIRDADADSLIKVVLFEERRRYEQAHPSGRSPGGPGSKRSVPPPLPGGRNGDEKRAR
jgi:outer membrane biosynthesis protein TonB